MGLGVLLLVAAPLVASDVILLRTDHERTAPPAEDVRPFLEMVCPSSRLGKDKDRHGVLACRTCPAWTSDPGGGTLAAIAISYGHFTMPGADQALVATEGCEPHSQNWGGSLLFTSHEGKWRFNRYLEGTITDNCATLQRTDGRTILVCGRHEGHQSVITRRLYTIDLLRPKDSLEVASLVLTDTMPSCGFDYASATNNDIYPLQKAVFQEVSVDARRQYSRPGRIRKPEDHRSTSKNLRRSRSPRAATPQDNRTVNQNL